MIPEETGTNRIDINTCSLEELASLKGISHETAQRIIDGRPYGRVEDLDRVDDIGPKTINDIKDEITCSTIEHVNVPHLVKGDESPDIDPNDKGVNANLSTLEDLMRVPKVGASLAARIVDGRPYGRADDLMRVDGISEQKLAEIRPYLTVGPDKATRSVDEPMPEKAKTEKKPKQTNAGTTVVPVVIAANSADDSTGAAGSERYQEMTPTPDAVEEDANQAEEKEPTVIVERRNNGLVWLVGFIVLVLAILLTLLALFLINKDLRYLTHRSIDDLETRMTTIEDEQAGMNDQMIELENTNVTLDFRITALEEDLAAMKTEIEDTSDLAEQLQTHIDADKDADLQTQIDALEERVTALEEKCKEVEELIQLLQTSGGTFESPYEP